MDPDEKREKGREAADAYRTKHHIPDEQFLNPCQRQVAAGLQGWEFEDYGWVPSYKLK